MKTHSMPEQDAVLDAIQEIARTLGRAPSKSEFMRSSGMTEHQVLRHFLSWREAVCAAGLDAHTKNLPLAPEVLLENWGELVRRDRRIPTRDQYRRDGRYSPSVFEKKFGPWSQIPTKFREFATSRPEWTDVLALLPLEGPARMQSGSPVSSQITHTSSPFTTTSPYRHTRLADRNTYGNPIDFRGLRHEPVNEQGVVFLFGMVARELGYHVEAVQAGFPDCEAKRQVDAGKWQRVRIEFEFDSRNFRDHGHPSEGCDIIVCWRHNWLECPPNLEVIELSAVIQTLSAAED